VSYEEEDALLSVVTVMRRRIRVCHMRRRMLCCQFSQLSQLAVSAVSAVRDSRVWVDDI